MSVSPRRGTFAAAPAAAPIVATDLPDQAPTGHRDAPVAARVVPRAARDWPSSSDRRARRCAGLLLAGGVPAPDLFPAAAWARCTARVLKSLAGELRLSSAAGLPVLREQIAAHLAATRGLIAGPGCIVVTAGTQQALRTAADLLLTRAIRSGSRTRATSPAGAPCSPPGRRLCRSRATPKGWMSRPGGSRPHARMALVAPSHATPLGGALPIGRRLALLDWAGRANAWVLEDDCDSEFRWEGNRCRRWRRSMQPAR